MSRASSAAASRDAAVETLRQWLTVGMTIHCILRHVSRSGMLRVIDLMIVPPDGVPRQLGPLAAAATDMTYDRDKSGIRIGGAGMDMGFALVYALGRAMYPKGFGLPGKQGEYDVAPPTSPEQAAKMVANGVEFYGRNADASGWEYDGGYAFTHRWL